METRYFKTLVTVVETGSFSKAARSLHLTQSAVSQRIKILEEAFDHSLFDRSGAALKLTAVGEIVLNSARQILGAEESLLARLSQISYRKKVSFCCTSTFGAIYLPRVLNRFMLDNGGTQIDLNFLLHNSDQALLGILNKEFDISVIEHCPKDDLSAFKTFPLPDDELVFVSSPNLNFPTQQCDVDELFQFSLFVREDGCSSKQLLMTGLEGQGKNLNDFATVATSDDLRLTCQMVLSGDGIAFMSKGLVCEYLQTGQMIEHSVNGFPRSRKRKIVMEKGREDEKLLSNLIRCIFSAMDIPSSV